MMVLMDVFTADKLAHLRSSSTVMGPWLKLWGEIPRAYHTNLMGKE